MVCLSRGKGGFLNVTCRLFPLGIGDLERVSCLEVLGKFAAFREGEGDGDRNWLHGSMR